MMPTVRSRAPSIVLVACFALLAGRARAQSIEDARRFYMDADFRAAQGAFEAVLRRADLDATTAATAHVYLAALALALREAEQARAHAETAVALRPDVAAPEGAPAELGRMLADARGRLGDRAVPLRIVADEPIAAAARSRVTARYEPAPPALRAALVLRCSEGDRVTEQRGAPPTVELEVSAAHALRCDARVETESGATLVEARRELAIAAPEARAASEPPRARTAPQAGRERVAVARDDDDSGGSAWPWIAVGGALVAAAVVVVAILLAQPDDATVGPIEIPWRSP